MQLTDRWRDTVTRHIDWQLQGRLKSSSVQLSWVDSTRLDLSWLVTTGLGWGMREGVWMNMGVAWQVQETECANKPKDKSKWRTVSCKYWATGKVSETGRERVSRNASWARKHLDEYWAWQTLAIVKTMEQIQKFCGS